MVESSIAETSTAGPVRVEVIAPSGSLTVYVDRAAKGVNLIEPLARMLACVTYPWGMGSLDDGYDFQFTSDERAALFLTSLHPTIVKGPEAPVAPDDAAGA